ncbi:hypothetical protein SEUCBS139899_006499 [Sporothrix eucalyptigena]|uniref:CHRD domain-containing protein n=1 Tax=Sporothrix eucalyptigena TaxID=1812306 RepID=A0ABP0CJH4_9PEZI
MCGEELPASAYAHRFGALAVMSPPIPSTSSSPKFRAEETASLSGSIAFFNDTDHDMPVATHVQFSPSRALPTGGRPSLLISIHDFGDFQFNIPEETAAGNYNGPLLHRLRKPLHLHVGEDSDGNRGIIGRRVTMYRVPSSAADRTPTTVLAEGIVGYNSLPRVEALL